MSPCGILVTRHPQTLGPGPALPSLSQPPRGTIAWTCGHNTSSNAFNPLAVCSSLRGSTRINVVETTESETRGPGAADRAREPQHGNKSATSTRVGTGLHLSYARSSPMAKRAARRHQPASTRGPRRTAQGQEIPENCNSCF